jgi:hypothetical protein
MARVSIIESLQSAPIRLNGIVSRNSTVQAMELARRFDEIDSLAVGGFFISYRRDDAAGHAGRLFDRLAGRFGREAVFMDHSTLAPGENFRGAIVASLSKADAVFAVIGPRWADARDEQQALRLTQPDDFVRLEILTALEMSTRVIPLLVGGATMPGEADLPAELLPLVRLQAWELRDARFDDDLQALLAQLPSPAAPTGSRSIAHVVSGEWLADVEYHWGTRVTERFAFEADGDELFGWATFLTGRHALEQVELLPDGLRFVLHSEATMGEERRRVEHRYRVRLDGEALHIRMQSSNGFDDGPPLVMTARRAS